MRNCLIVIDLQHDFLDRLGVERRANLIGKTNDLVRMFRSAGCAVVWVKQTFKADLSDAFLEMRNRRVSNVIEGTSGSEIASDLAKCERDIVVVKKRYSAFFGTDLDHVLSDLDPDEITLAGVNTHACIRTTAIDAYQRDMRVILASECIESHDAEHAEISMTYMDGKIAVAMTNRQIAARLT